MDVTVPPAVPAADAPHGAAPAPGSATFQSITRTITRQHHKKNYPAVFRGLLIAGRCAFPHVTIVPVDYGSVAPFNIDDLCINHWLQASPPEQVNRRLCAWQSKIITHSPFSGLALESPIAIFTYRARPFNVGRNELLWNVSGKTCRYYGDVFAVKLNNSHSLEPVHVDGTDVRFITNLVAEVLASGGMPQGPY